MHGSVHGSNQQYRSQIALPETCERADILVDILAAAKATRITISAIRSKELLERETTTTTKVGSKKQIWIQSK